jgi:hypothetical protein
MEENTSLALTKQLISQSGVQCLTLWFRMSISLNELFSLLLVLFPQAS